MAKITLDLSGISGLAPRYYGDKNKTASSPSKRYLGGEAMAEGVFNPITTYGYLSPANNTTKAVTGTSSFLLTSAIVVPFRLAVDTTDAVFFADEAEDGSTGSIKNLDTAVDTTLDQAYTIPSFTSGVEQYSKSEDLILYQVNGAVRTFFTRTCTTTAGLNNAIGITFPTFASSQDEDWSIGVPSGASASLLKADGRIVFVLSDNGFLYVLNGNNVHKIDGGTTGGTNGTITPRVLTFLGSTTDSGVSTSTRLIDGVDHRGKMWLGLHVNAAFDTDPNSASSINGSISSISTPMFVGVYVWNRQSTTASMQDFIPISGVKELKSLHTLQGKTVCFTISTDGYTQLRIWDGVSFKVVKTLGNNAYPPYRRHSVYEADDMLYWIGNDGKVYAYGKVDESSQGNALYIIGDMTSHITANETWVGAGVLVPVNAAETVTSGNATASLAFYISFKDTGGNHLKKWYPFGTDTIASNAQIGHRGDVYTLVKYLPDMSTVRYVDIRCAPTSATGTTTIATVKYYFNGNSSASITKSITKDQASRGYVRHDLNKPFVNSIQIEIEWDITVTQGTANSFLPSVAIIDYSPTTTKG
jgi:hypothetical protein